MTKVQFISRVMQIMNELGWSDTESGDFIGSDTTKIEGHIESVFVDAWRKATKIFPKTYFEVKDFSDSELVSDIESGTGHVKLPEDFHLLYQFKMHGWQKAVETLYDNSDPMASMQANEFVRGSSARPVCVKNIVNSVEVAEYYSLPKGLEHIVEIALYIPIMGEPDDTVPLKEKLITPLAYICASMVFTIFEKNDIAKVLESKALEIAV